MSVVDAGGGAQGPHRLFVVQGSESSGTVIEDFTLRGGASGTGWGGAILCESSSLTLRDCALEDNSSDGRGGAVYCGDGALQLEGCTLEGNAAQDGGAVYVVTATVTASDCGFHENAAQGSGLQGKGAAVALELNSEATLTRCKFENNRAASFGGAVWTQDSSASLTNCLLAGNRANSYGGGAYGENAGLTLDRCTLSGNVSQWYGGGIHAHSNSTVDLQNSICWANAIGENGAGPQLSLSGETQLSAAYNDVQGGAAAVAVASGSQMTWDTSNMDVDPQFARVGHWRPSVWPEETALWWPGDFHLRSTMGRWQKDSAGPADFNGDAIVNMVDFSVVSQEWLSTEPDMADLTQDGLVDAYDLAMLARDYLEPAAAEGQWVQDMDTSALLDRGDPAAGYGDEPMPNGGQLNMGAYGGTAEASMSPPAE
jgi:predicted outer membrane repeat protein